MSYIKDNHAWFTYKGNELKKKLILSAVQKCTKFNGGYPKSDQVWTLCIGGAIGKLMNVNVHTFEKQYFCTMKFHNFFNFWGSTLNPNGFGVVVLCYSILARSCNYLDSGQIYIELY